MSAAQKIIDKKTLQVLVPFNALSPVHFNEVAQKTVVEEVRAGRLVFKAGDRDNQSVYVLDGEISLLAGNEIVGAVVAGSDAGRHPIAQQQPRQVSARAKTNVVIARIDSSLLDIMLTWDQSSGYEVSEISDDDDDDWMTRILQSQTFLKLPPSNIQRLLMKVESIPVQAGDVIIQQGGEGDYFYIIKNGRCMVSRKPSANAKEVKLAELADGDAFGEDALVSDAKRNATITMMTDGVLMRLAKKDFVELLKEPLLNKLDYAAAAALVRKGATWLDVRLPGEFENVHIQDSRNIPLSALRLEANGLSNATPYIVCCDTGRRSASAAFVLSQRGFEVYVLTEGFSGVPAEALVGSASGTPLGTPLGAPLAVPGTASVVELKPQAVPNAAMESASASIAAEAVTALQGNLESLQREKQTLESAQAQLVARVGALQEELERLREASREQVLELETILTESRQEGVATRKELQALKDAQRQADQADAATRDQAEALEAELSERRAQEAGLQQELLTLRTRIAELDATAAADAEWRASALAEQTQLQARIDALQSQAEQATQHLARIQELETALHAAQQQGTQSQTEQAQRLHELETALQTATASLEQVRRDAEQQQSDLQTEHARALEAAQVAAVQQIAELQARLGSLEAVRTEAEARLAAHEQQTAEERARGAAQQQSDQHALAELQARIETLDQDLARATTAAADTQAQREQAQARVCALEADASTQIPQLETALEELRQQMQSMELERASLHHDQAQLQQERDALRTDLEQAQSRVQALSADAGEQIQSLEAALETAHRELQAQQTEHANLNAAQVALAAEHAAVQTLLDETQAAFATAQGTANAVQAERDQMQTVIADLEARLVDAQARVEQGALGASEALLAAQTQRDALQSELTTAVQQLEQLHQAQQQAVTDAEAKGRTALAGQLEEARSELDSARAALARELEQRSNLAQATQAEFAAAKVEAAAALERNEAALTARQEQLAEAESARRELTKQLATLQTATASQQQSLLAELEQLRQATTADIEAMHAQMQGLQDELVMARKLSVGGSVGEELQRLHILLDQAREEAASARADAEQWHVQPDVAAPVRDEAAALRGQLSDMQARVDEASQWRETAEREIEQLREELRGEELRGQELQARDAQAQTSAAPLFASAAMRTEPAPSRASLWIGLATGAVLGALCVGALSWFGKPADVVSTAADAAPARAAQVLAAAPVMPVVSKPVPAAVPVPEVAEITAPEPVATQTTVNKGREFRDGLNVGGRGPALIEIATTRYAMGSGASSLDFNERPKHDVDLRHFAIGKYEVTFEEFDAFARATGRALPDDKGRGRGRRPVVNVSWEEATAYARWLSEQTGKRYRLPTEAEWEYAAGNLGRGLYWWGNTPGEKRANCFNCGSEWDAHMTAPVGSFTANPLGLYDTAGNAIEWVQDCYHPDYASAPTDGSAWVNVSCTRRVIRGGGFNSPASALRLTKRDQQLSSMRMDDLGFRVARDL